MSIKDNETDIYKLEDGDDNIAEVIYGEYTPDVGGTVGAVDAWLKFIATYAIDPKNIFDGFDFTGTPTSAGKVQYDENDVAGYLEDKLKEGVGVTLTPTGTTNKELNISLSISETTESGFSLLKDSTTLQKLVAGNLINISSDGDVITISSTLNPDDYLKTDGSNSMTGTLNGTSAVFSGELDASGDIYHINSLPGEEWDNSNLGGFFIKSHFGTQAKTGIIAYAINLQAYNPNLSFITAGMIRGFFDGNTGNLKLNHNLIATDGTFSGDLIVGGTATASPSTTNAHLITQGQVSSTYAPKATTIAGYNITDAYTKTEIENRRKHYELSTNYNSFLEQNGIHGLFIRDYAIPVTSTPTSIDVDLGSNYEYVGKYSISNPSAFTITLTFTRNVVIDNSTTTTILLPPKSIIKMHYVWINSGSWYVENIEGMYGYDNDLNVTSLDVSSTDYDSIKTAGGIRSTGGNWEDDNIDTAAFTGGGSAPNIGTIIGNIESALFPPSQIKEISTSRELLHKRKSGTPLKFHAHCFPTSTNTGTVRIGLEYSFGYEGEVLTTPVTIYAQEAMPGTAIMRKTINFADITVPTDANGKDFAPQFYFRFFRDATNANDTYTDDVGISTIGYHYNIDALGSDEVVSKTYA